MKKRVGLAAALCATLFAFSTVGCASTKVDYMAESAEKTPENSVLMIFIGQASFDLYQMNPAFEPDKIPVVEASGCTTPMQPGSCYIVTEQDDRMKMKWLGAASVPDSLPLSYLNAAQTDSFTIGRKIIVPEKPGLYVEYLMVDVEKAKENGAIVIGGQYNTVEKWKESGFIRRFVRRRLEKSAKAYAGTAWEPLIREQIEEWK